MGNVLIISSHQTFISDLEQCFHKEGISSKIVTYEELNHDYALFKLHCFILFHAEYSESINIQIIKHLRKQSKWPVYAITQHEDVEVIKKYFEAGIEGHVTFKTPCELISNRIKAVLRYIDSFVHRTSEVIQVTGITIDLNNRLIKSGFQTHKLTLNEYQILSILVSEKNRVVSKDELISRIWDHHSSATDNALGIHISRLRKKTITDDNKQLIETIWGVGYRLNIEYNN